MATSTHVTVWCNAPGCSNWHDSGERTVRLARQRAKDDGWRVGVPDRTRRPGNNARLDFCNDHIEAQR